jgi:hypothetical protein
VHRPITNDCLNEQIGAAGHHPVVAHSAPTGVPLSVGGAGGVGGVAEPSVLISVSEYVLCSIICSGGSVIKENSQRSRAQNSICDPSPTGGDRTITITGSRQCNEVAVALVYEKIAAAEGYRKMGGGDGSGGRGRRERNTNGQQQATATSSGAPAVAAENKAADE